MKRYDSKKPIFPSYLLKNPAISIATYSNQEHIYNQGQPLNDISIIQQGHVKLYRLTQYGRQIILSILGINEVIGVPENSPHVAQEFASAQGEVILYRISIANFDALLTSENEFCQFIVDSHARRLMALQNRLFSIMNKKVHARVAALMCDLAVSTNDRCMHDGEIDIIVSQQEIADMVGASRQTINALLNDWRKKRIIRYSRDNICLLNLPILMQLAES